MSQTAVRNEKLTSTQLLTIATNVLHKAFHDCPRADAKRRFRAMEDGSKVFLLEMASEQGGKVRVTMSLDRSEFRGRLNFSLLRGLIGQLLVTFSQALGEKQPLNTFSDEQRNRCVFLPPAVSQADGEINMLVLSVDVGTPGTLELALMFVDPEQFRRQQPASV